MNGQSNMLWGPQCCAKCGLLNWEVGFNLPQTIKWHVKLHCENVNTRWISLLRVSTVKENVVVTM